MTGRFDEWVPNVSTGERLRVTPDRPLVDQISGSRHQHMKELRAGTVRILFAFDPTRQAILLVAGDKRGTWNEWYRIAIPLADDRYDDWVTEQKKEKQS